MGQISSYTIVIMERNPNYFIVKCGSCNGAGCASCDRYGKRRLDVPSSWDCIADVFRCGSCGGSGCASCNRVGAFVGCSPRVTCGSCNGAGCASCDRRGSVWVGNLR